MNNYYKKITIWIYAIILMPFLLVANDKALVQHPSLIPDPKIQAGIMQFMDAIKEVSLKEHFSEKLFNSQIDAFFSTNGVPEEVDLVQLLLLYGGEKEHRVDPQSEMLTRVMLFHFVLNMDAERILAIVAPLMDTTDDPILLKKLEMPLHAVFTKTGRFEPDQAEVRQYLLRYKDNPPYGLIKFMYRAGRGASLYVVNEVYGDKPTKRDIENLNIRKKYTQEDIKRMMASGQWWEELYAAEQMRQNPKLRNHELIKQLGQSKHAVVRKTIKKIENEKKSSAD